MKYKDYYHIEIRSDDKVLEVIPSEFSFALTDSIYKIYNTAIVEIHDSTGLLQEYLLTVNNLPVTITYGTDDKVLTCDYIIVGDELSKPEVQGLLNGKVKVDLINKWLDEQEIKSVAYNKRISEIITKIARKYFKTTDIDLNDTGNQAIWYQMLMTDSDFIKNILLPNAFSHNAENTPFYCYITNDNVFHFKNLKAMFKSSPVATVNYVIETKSNFKPNSAFSIERWRKDLNRDVLYRYVYYISKKDGTLIRKKDKITDYPNEPQGLIPIYSDNKKITNYIDLNYEETETGLKENKLGQQIDSMRESIFLERMNITLPFNPVLKAGANIDLNIFKVTTENEPSSKSNNFSGRYVIERCTHVWDGTEQKGYTKIVVGRKYLHLPSSYLLRGKLIQ